MRVVAVGGAANMALPALQLLDDSSTSLVIADRRLAAAQAVVTRLHHGRWQDLDAAELDVRDGKRLARLLHGADLVINTVGPYFEFGTIVLDAAIAAGADYLDVCDDPGPTVAMLQRGTHARQAGVRAVIGMGASPGITSMLARMAWEQLDEVREVHTYWSIEDAADDETPTSGGRLDAALVHWFEQLTGQVLGFEDGAVTEVRPLVEGAVYLPGVGLTPTWTCGHPEPITMGSRLPGLRTSTNAMVGPPATIRVLRALSWSVDHTPLGPTGAARLLTWLARLDRRTISTDEDRSGTTRTLPALAATAIGRKGDEPAAVAAMLPGLPPGGMAGATGIPLGIMARHLLKVSATPAPGVHAPEATMDPEHFFSLLVEQGGSAVEVAGTPPP